MKRTWVHEQSHNGFEIQRLEPPRQQRPNYRYMTINAGVWMEAKSLAECQAAIDTYGKWFENVGEKIRLAKIQLLLQGILADWIDLTPTTMEWPNSKDELLEILDRADTMCYRRLNLTWNGEAWVKRPRAGWIGHETPIETPHPYPVELLLNLLQTKTEP